MSRRDDDTTLRALVAAQEANNVTLRAIVDRLERIDGHVNTLIDTVAEHIRHHEVD